jgi:hypothetical protein
MSQSSHRHRLAHSPKHRDVNRLLAKTFFDGTKLPLVVGRPKTTTGSMFSPSRQNPTFQNRHDLPRSARPPSGFGANTSCGSDTPRRLCRPIFSSAPFDVAAKLADVTTGRPSSAPTFSNRAAAYASRGARHASSIRRRAPRPERRAGAQISERLPCGRLWHRSRVKRMAELLAPVRARDPLPAHRAQERRPAGGSRSDVVFSSVVDRGREDGHGNIDAALRL